MATTMSTYTFAGCVGIFYILAVALAANPRLSPPFAWQAHQRFAAARSRSDSEPAVGEDATDFVCNGAGKFSLQSNCTHYISCSEELKATLVACPACELDSDNCPEGRWHFSPQENECVWPKEWLHCGPPKPTTTTTTTPKPDDGECELDCFQIGECLCYDTCVPDNSSSTGGRWKKQWCDKLPNGDWLYWNNDISLFPDGGKCDFWGNLRPDLQEYYQNLPVEDCPTPPPPCFWREHKTCDNKYYYLPTGMKNDEQKLELRCPENPSTGDPLWWSQERLSCVFKCRKEKGNCRKC